MTSPDYQIVTFTLFGVEYLYEGGSARLEVLDGIEAEPIKFLLERELQDMVLHHVPASTQIEEALANIGFRPDQMPAVTYTDDQPDDALPPGAVS